MRLLDEIAHRHGKQADRVTDFYFTEREHRYKVVETASPSRIVGGEVETLDFRYVVLALRPVGWVEVARLGQDHVETAMQAAQVAHRIVTGDADTGTQPFTVGWFGFEPEPDMTGDGSGDPDKHILTIVADPGGDNEELAVIVHRTVDGKFPIDGPLADHKRRTATWIVDSLNASTIPFPTYRSNA